MAKTRLVVYCDGTWNTPDEVRDGKPCQTNVTNVDNAFQTLAVDEPRKHFTPSVWQQHPGRRLEQVWFAGAVHASGGYPETGLYDIALAWMAARATECGLALGFDAVSFQLVPQSNGLMHDSMWWNASRRYDMA